MSNPRDDERRKFEALTVTSKIAEENGSRWIQCETATIRKLLARAEQAETPRAAQTREELEKEWLAQTEWQDFTNWLIHIKLAEPFCSCEAGSDGDCSVHGPIAAAAPTGELLPHSSQIHTDLRVRCRDCSGYQIWRYLEDEDVIEVFHDCVAGRAKKAAATPTEPSRTEPSCPSCGHKPHPPGRCSFSVGVMDTGCECAAAAPVEDRPAPKLLEALLKIRRGRTDKLSASVLLDDLIRELDPAPEKK